MIYDVIIVWAWAAWLFAGIQLDKKLNKLILEKTAKPGMKVLLSGWERANVSNMDIEPVRDYFTQNKKFLHSIFSRYNQWDIMSFFAENNVSIVEEDRSRLILESGNSKELLSCLIDNLERNNGQIITGQDVIDIIPVIIEESVDKMRFYTIKTREWKEYKTKNVILSSGWKSFWHVGTTGEGYSIAEKLGIEIVTPYRTLCGMATKRDLSEISWVSSVVNMQLFDKNNKKGLYLEKGPILFTHFWVSGPIIHNLSNAIWEYVNKLWLKEEEFERYIIENLLIKLDFDLENSAKRLVKFFELSDDNLGIELELQNWRSWKEAKATGGWISTASLDNHMQIKNHLGLYCIWEVIDVTGKTWGFNLQWAWSSAFVAAQHINKQ